MAKAMSFGYDGDGGLGDRLLAAVLRGEKTATSSLAIGYLSGDPVPRVGERLPLVDHDDGVHGVVETTRVTITPLHLVGDDVAHDEGEGFAGAAAWRRDHVAYWTELTDVLRSEAGDPGWELREAEPVVVERFRLLDFGGAPPSGAEMSSRFTIVKQDRRRTRTQTRPIMPPTAYVNDCSDGRGDVGCAMWSVAGTAVDRLAEKIHVAEVAGVLLDEVGEDPT